MSGKLNGAVYKHGPRTKAKRTLLRLACNADDHGFAQIRQTVIARDLDLSRDSVIRDLKQLAAQGWIYTASKAVDGCENVYFLNRAKLGITDPPKGRKSPLHLEFLDRMGRKWQGPRFAQVMVQNPLSTSCNSQGEQVAKPARQVAPVRETCCKPPLPNKEAPLFLHLSVDPPSLEGATTAGEDFFSEVRGRGGGLRRIA